MSDAGDKPESGVLVISKGTGMTIGVAIALCAPLLWAVRAEANVMHAIELNRRASEQNADAVRDLREEMREGFDQIESRTSDRLTRTMFRNWLDMARAVNHEVGVVLPELPD